MKMDGFLAQPRFVPEYDQAFQPAALFCRSYIQAVEEADGGVPLVIAVERNEGLVSTYKTQVFAEGTGYDDVNFLYIERLIKTLLWVYGGWKITLGGPKGLGERIKACYAPGGLRAFDAEFMSGVYEKPFTVEVTDAGAVPEQNEKSKPLGRNLDGCRIGFDAGGSDIKVSAVIEGKPVFSEEVVWHPKTQTDPEYHYEYILKAMKTAAAHLPKVDAIGVSSAGIYINNRVMVASLFIKVARELFNQKVKDIFLKMQEEFGGVPLEVANDGDVTALAGAMELDDTGVLGIAMGTSEAGGYVDLQGNITGWLNELAFVPVDFHSGAMRDEWSGDYGCGVKYFSQDGVIKLAGAAGIQFDENASPAEKLKVVQGLLRNGDARVRGIFSDIGIYLGYSIAYYAQFYDIKHLLILGRVTSGEGGELILENARKVLGSEFPELADKIRIHLPDESSRRVGQSIAAASLPKL